MKRLMMKYFMVNCKEATFLMGKKEESKLTLVERVKLYMHTAMCSFCKKFETQINVIAKESLHIHAEESLPTNIREKVQKMFKEHF